MAKVDGHQQAHRLFAGFPIEHALRSLANDPANHSDIRNLSRVALTGGEKGLDGPGAPEALWMLADALDENNHPAKDSYRWRSAADKVHTDEHVYHALSTAADANATADGLHYAYGEKRANWRHRPEGVAQQAVFGMEKNSPYRSTHDFVVARAKAILPQVTDKDIEESLRRHYVRASRVYDAEHGHPMEGHNRKAIGDIDDHELRGEGMSYKNLKATRYRRYRRPRRYGRRDLMAWLDTNGGFHGVKTHGTHEAWADANGTTKADLQAAGWMRVTPGGSTLWAANPHRGPNERQKSALVDAAMEHGFDTLSHDNDRAERVLWSNTERLNRGRPHRYGRADIEMALRAHRTGHPVPADIFNDLLQDEGGLGASIGIAAAAHGHELARAAAGYLHAPDLTHEIVSREPSEPGQWAFPYRGRSGRTIEPLERYDEATDSVVRVDPHLYYPLDRLRLSYRPPGVLRSIHAQLAPWQLHGLLPAIPSEHRDAVRNWLATQIPEAAAGHARNAGRGRPELKNRRRYALNARGDFIDSLRRVRSRQQQALKRAAQQVSQRLGLYPVHLVDALHDGPQGATPGVAQAIYSNASPEAVQGAAAYLAMINNATGFGVFHVRPNGPDYLHKFRVSGSGLDLRHRLDRAGIADRVLVPHRSGYDVLVPDPAGRLARNVRQFAGQAGADLQTSRGHFRVVGDADQDRAREMFRGTLERMRRAKRRA